MILDAAEGLSNDEIARLDTRREVVWLWRKRFFADRLAVLEEHARPGRPRTFPPQISSVKLRWRVNYQPNAICRCLAEAPAIWFSSRAVSSHRILLPFLCA
jgi:hypothetical protein